MTVTPIEKITLFTLIFFVLGGWGCDTAKRTSEINLADATWNQVASTDGSRPVARHEAAFTAVGDMLVLLGGRGDRATSIYDLNRGVWSSASPPPIEMHHFQPVVYQGKIYVLGAMTGPYPGETPVEHIYIYDPQNDRWQTGDPIPEDRLRGGAGAVLHGDKIYLACGIKDGHRGDHKQWLDVYDISEGSWARLADAPRPRDHFQLARVGEKLYAIGGRTTIAADNPFRNTMTQVDVYNIEANVWTTLENGLPTPRAGNFVHTLGEEIWVLGGESFFQEPAHSEVEILNSRTSQWRDGARLPQGRHGTGVAIVGRKMYTSSGAGNRGGGPELDDLWVLGQ